MKKVVYIIALIIFAGIAIAATGSFSIVLKTDGEQVILESVSLYNIRPPVYIVEEEHDMIARVMSFKGEELYNFTFRKIISYYETESIPTEDYLEFSFPQYREAKEVEIISMKTNRTELVIDLTPYQSCNFDSFCDMNEDKESCPEDCDLKHLLEAEPKAEPIKEEQKMIAELEPVTSVKKGPAPQSYIIIIIAALIIAAILFIAIRKKRSSQ